MRARRPHHTKNRLSSKPVKTTRSLPTCQPIVPTGFPPVLHNSGSSTAGKIIHKGSSGYATERNLRSSGAPCFGTTSSETYFGNPAEAEVSKLRKRSCGGSCENAKTLRGSLSPNDNPVAGANFRGYLVSVDLMPDKRREIQRKRPASHILLSTFVFYITSAGGAQGGVY